MRIYPSVGAKYTRNLKLANSNEFVPHMIEAIPADCEFRIHVSGDFKDAIYVTKWIEICKARPDVEFYSYTRSWGITGIWQFIRKLAQLPNVNVNLSCDIESGKPKAHRVKFYRWAYLTHDKAYGDTPDWLRRDDIVFRSASGGHKTRRKNAVNKGKDPNEVAPLVSRIGSAPVCPFERGQKLDSFSCSQCRICIRKPGGALANA
jgi:hypothetical protein